MISWRRCSTLFQSAPRFSREANAALCQRCHLSHVSIRASLQPRGERIKPCTNSFVVNVSIRASLQPRGELSKCGFFIGFNRFNPRLASAARRTTKQSEFFSLLSVSIRASLQPRGERNTSQSMISTNEFQSAPRFSREANKYRIKAPIVNPAFQSAPRFSRVSLAT